MPPMYVCGFIGQPVLLQRSSNNNAGYLLCHITFSRNISKENGQEMLCLIYDNKEDSVTKYKVKCKETDFVNVHL